MSWLKIVYVVTSGLDQCENKEFEFLSLSLHEAEMPILFLKKKKKKHFMKNSCKLVTRSKFYY